MLNKNILLIRVKNYENLKDSLMLPYIFWEIGVIGAQLVLACAE